MVYLDRQKTSIYTSRADWHYLKAKQSKARCKQLLKIKNRFKELLKHNQWSIWWVISHIAAAVWAIELTNDHSSKESSAFSSSLCVALLQEHLCHLFKITQKCLCSPVLEETTESQLRLGYQSLLIFFHKSYTTQRTGKGGVSNPHLLVACHFLSISACLIPQ